MRRLTIAMLSVVAAFTFAACDYEADQEIGGVTRNGELADEEEGLAAGEQRLAPDEEQLAAEGLAEDEGAVGAQAEAGEVAEAAADARDLVQEATGVVEQMKNDPELARMLDQARGVFIVPEYGKGAAIIGARGGEGVLLARGQNGAADEWTGPLFYDIGAISVGPQLGGAGGDIAMLLMNEDAVESFRDDNNFSLNADAGFTLVDYTARAQATAGKGDVFLWSDMEGAFAGVALSVTDIALDQEQNQAYYAQRTTPAQILSGEVQNQHADVLLQQLEGAPQATG